MTTTEKSGEIHHETTDPAGSDLETGGQLKPIDTLHGDEAVRVLANYSGDEVWTEKEEAHVTRKIDWRLMPILCVTYGLQYYDKAMLSQAALFGLRDDLKLRTGNRYSMSAAIFYLGFIVGSYPAMYLAQRWPIERVASGIVTVWGICLILTVVCRDYKDLYAQRFFLGLLEAGISPMFMVIVGSFYKKNEQAFRMGIWYSCTGYVSIFSPLINYGLGQAKGPLRPWKYMYIFAGSLTIVWGIALWWLLPPDPVRAGGFNERERYISVARLRSNNSGVRNTHFKIGQVLELLMDEKFWLVFAIATLCMISNGPISTFIPIIINSFGFTTLNSLLLTAPAGAYAGTMQLLVPWLCYKYTGWRTWAIFACQMGTTLAALLLWQLPLKQTGALLFACYILPSVGAGYAVLMGLALANTAGYTKRTVTSSGIYIGYCLGNFIGPILFKPEDAPRYAPGFIVVFVTAIIAGLLAVVYRFWCVAVNRKRDKTGVLEGFEHAYEDDLTDRKNPQFRYILTGSTIPQQRRRGSAQTFNCDTVGRPCNVRPSKREKRRKVNKSAATAQSTSIPEGLEGFPEERSPRVTGMAHNEAISGLAETTPTQNGDVDAGFLKVYAQENQFDAETQAIVAQMEHRYCSGLDPDLEQIFTDTYFEYCYPWCPVLDRVSIASDIARSPLLANALALASSHIRPPLLPHSGPNAYYKRARTIFYDDQEADEMMALKALCLFYWWAPQSPSRVHRHSSWWWTSVIIRHAQQMNIHREPSLDDPSRQRLQLGLRRRIWWTAFARERLTSLCQSKPAIIDPKDCSIQEPALADFPTDPQSQHHGEIFIYWVRLCAIIGRIAKFLLKSNTDGAMVPSELREELVAWVHSLPPHLKLPIDTSRTTSFDRDVHQLHLFYLTTIIILHLKRSEGHLPQALPPAILAASCTARILRDILARGNSRFLMAITCWHVGTAFIALLQACRIPQLSKSANDDLDVLSIAVKELQKMWASANVVAQGFDRLRKPQTVGVAGLEGIEFAESNQDLSPHTVLSQTRTSYTSAGTSNLGDGFDWMRFFPFVSKSTGGIAESLTTRGFPSPNGELFHETLLAQFQDLFDPFTDYNLGLSEIDFDAPQV
ncbi:major facilitator superfamily domain-containing protein [Phaeosphaeria sp. MPI-PUGE-AT-0046c]|nr:major facilitator superfamily domain-containing protein [Phaeosphaeria sp. MPI-PUGE-AT-0046c]